MATITIEWTAFPDGNELQYGDQVMGIRGGIDTRFDFPGLGVKDNTGAYMVQWASAGVNPVNYLKFINSVSGNPVTITAAGETNIDIDIIPAGTGVVNISTLAVGTLTISGTLTVGNVSVGNLTVTGDFDAGLADGELLIGSTGNPAVRSTLTAGTGTSIVNAAGSSTISSATTSLVAWTTVGGGGATMAARNGYIANAGTLVSLALPATFNVGDTISIINLGAGFFRITQGAGQSIRLGTSLTTTGAGGYLEATALGDSITLVGVVANTTLAVLGGPQGAFTVV